MRHRCSESVLVQQQHMRDTREGLLVTRRLGWLGGIQFQLLDSVQLSSRKKTLAGPWAVSSDSAPERRTRLPPHSSARHIARHHQEERRFVSSFFILLLLIQPTIVCLCPSKCACVCYNHKRRSPHNHCHQLRDYLNDSPLLFFYSIGYSFFC